MADTLKDRILKTLIESKQIQEEDIEQAKNLAKVKKLTLEKALIEMGFINEKELLVLLVRELNIPFINLAKYKIDPELQEIIPEQTARQYGIIPISHLENTLTVAVSDPLNVFAIDDLKSITGKDIDIVMSTNDEIVKVIDTYYGTSKDFSVTELSRDIVTDDFEIISEQDHDENVEGSVDESEKAPIIRMVNLIIKDALKQSASDIHIEPKQNGMEVRFRVDGVLHEILQIPKENQNAVITRIKIMSRLDITVQHIPQDGRFKLKLGNKEVDFRVSLLPTTHGQKIVMRVLDKSSLAVGLEGLGFSKRPLELMEGSVTKPFGMILVTGPTGSGKSTTLYSLISKLNTVDKNVITVEDPVEYLIEGLTQIQARPEIGLTFAEGLRSILRQSPDVVMVGEIRDNETADIAIKASLTGQLVFSTLHTNDASGALTRLVDMGVEPFLVSSSLVLISAQRLCRRVCPNCKEELKEYKKSLSNLNIDLPKNAKFYYGKGCSACRDSGYKGRLGIAEVIEVDDDVRTLLLQGKSSEAIKAYVRKEQGMETLFENALDKALKGETTLEEVLRVTAND